MQNWSSSDFRLFPKYYGDINPNRISQYFHGLVSGKKFNCFEAAPSVIGFLPSDFTTLVKEKKAEGRRSEYGSKVYSVVKIPKLRTSKSKKSIITDLKLSPFNDLLLAASHDIGCVNIWELPSSYNNLNDIDKARISIDNLSTSVECLEFHPSASNVLAVGGNDSVCVLDLNENGSIKYSTSSIFNGSKIVSLNFTRDGSLIRGVTKKGELFSFDCRTSPKESSSVIFGKVSCNPETITHLNMSDNTILISGMTDFKNPIIQIYDISKGTNTNFSDPLYKKSFNHKSCYALQRYDSITNLLYLTFRSTSDLYVFDIKKPNNLEKVAQYHLPSDTYQSFDIVPKYGLKKREINRCILMTKHKMLNLTHHKGGKIIYSSILNKEPKSTLSSEDYFNSKNGKLKMNCKLVSPDFEEKENRKVSLYLHCKGSVGSSNDQHYTHIITGSCNLSLGKSLKNNNNYLIFPSKTTGGGGLGVINLHKRGRQSQAEIRAHSDKISCYDISQLNNSNLLATGSTDCKVFIWQLPNDPNKLNSNNIKKLNELQHSGKITYLGFHPTAPNILISCERSINSSNISFFDLTDVNDIKKKIYLKDISNNGGSIMDVQFDTTGHLAAITSQDKKLRIIDPLKDGKILLEFECNESMRDTKVFWIHNDNYILTLGFRKGSIRSFSVYDVSHIRNNLNKQEEKEEEKEKEKENKNEMKAIYEKTFGVDNAIPMGYYDRDSHLFYITFVGDRKIELFELGINSCNLMVGNYIGKTNILGVSYLAKKYVNVRKVELAHCFVLGKDKILPVEFCVPRKRKEYFQDDLYPDTIDIEDPIYSNSNNWFEAGDGIIVSTEENIEYNMNVKYMKPEDMDELSQAPPQELTEYQKKHNKQLKQREQSKFKEQPRSTEQAMESFSKMVSDAPTTNRWDQQNVGTEVSDSEWDD